MLRIAHVVTLISPDGAYGGPVRVAVNQLQALAERGHEVTLFAGHRGYLEPPTSIDGVPVVSFPARTAIPGTGFAGLMAPGLTRELRRRVDSFDVVQVHLARDLVTLPAARVVRRAGVPLFVQTHGMIDPSTNPLAGPLDAVLTRPALRAASAVFHLTERERRDLIAVGTPEPALVQLVNGVPDPGDLAADPAASNEVLFLARLHARKRPTEFVRAAICLADEFPDAEFTLVGPDEGEGAAVKRLIEASGRRDRIRWEGPLPPERTLERMSRAAVYVLPSVDEPFPMSVLEAASLGLPVIVTDSCGLAPIIEEAGAGAVIDGRQSSLVSTISALLADAAARGSKGVAARTLARARFSMSAVVDRLTSHYAAGSVRQATPS